MGTHQSAGTYSACARGSNLQSSLVMPLSLMKDAIGDNKVILSLLGIVAAFLVGVTLLELRTVLVPFSVAVLLSIMFQPLVVFFKKKKIPTYLTLTAVLLSLALALGLIGLVVYQSARSLTNSIDHYESRIDEIVEEAEGAAARFAGPLGVELEDLEASQVIDVSFFSTLVTTGLGSFFSFLANAFMVLLFMLFILAGSGEFTAKVKQAYPPEIAARVDHITQNITRGVRRYLVAKTFVSGLTGVLVGLVLWILGVDFPVFWGFVTFVLNYIPNIGSIAAVILAFLSAALQFHTLTIPLTALAAMVVIQMIVGNWVDPWVMSANLDLSPLLVIVSLIFWGWLWGIAGAVLAVPLTATIKIIFENVSGLRPLAVIMGAAPKPTLEA